MDGVVVIVQNSVDVVEVAGVEEDGGVEERGRHGGGD
jgi:hypothetical protein